MNKTAIIVVGSLAVLGIGAFFLFKSKANPNVSGNLDSGLTNNSGANTSVSSSASNNNSGTLGSGLEATNNTSSQTKDLAVYSQAQALATQIVNLRSGIKPAIFQFGGDMQTYMRNMAQNGQIQGEISNIATQMGALGYKEVNGIAQKI